MNKVESMQAFCLVAEGRSFSKAAIEMGVSATMVSRYIKQLEQELGCLLLKRNTRKVYVTDAGHYYLQQIKPVLKKLDVIEQSMHNLNEEPTGQLTISASLEFGSQYLAPLIKQYRKACPKVQLNLNLTNEPIDLFSSEVELAFRVAPMLPNASHIAQEVCTSRLALWASNEYLAEKGEPASIEDLHHHELLFFAHSIRKDQWIFNRDDKLETKHFNWAWASNNGRLLNEAAAQHQGVIQAPAYSVAKYVNQGLLREILPQHSIQDLAISAVYPHRYELSNRVKSFVEMAKAYFKESPIP